MDLARLDPEGARTLARALADIEAGHALIAQASAKIRTVLQTYPAPESEPKPELRTTPQADRAEPWLGKRQIAAHLGVSPSWVERRAADSGLPFVRLGGINRYRASEVDRWVASGRGPGDARGQSSKP